MITMEDYVQNLLASGAIDREAARAAMMLVTESVEDRDEGHASAALGGGKMGSVDAPTNVKKSAAAMGVKDAAPDADSDEGYSF